MTPAEIETLLFDSLTEAKALVSHTARKYAIGTSTVGHIKMPKRRRAVHIAIFSACAA
jgi:hypothetical protein